MSISMQSNVTKTLLKFAATVATAKVGDKEKSRSLTKIDFTKLTSEEFSLLKKITRITLNYLQSSEHKDFNFTQAFEKEKLSDQNIEQSLTSICNKLYDLSISTNQWKAITLPGKDEVLMNFELIRSLFMPADVLAFDDWEGEVENKTPIPSQVTPTTIDSFDDGWEMVGENKLSPQLQITPTTIDSFDGDWEVVGENKLSIQSQTPPRNIIPFDSGCNAEWENEAPIQLGKRRYSNEELLGDLLYKKVPNLKKGFDPMQVLVGLSESQEPFDLSDHGKQKELHESSKKSESQRGARVKRSSIEQKKLEESSELLDSNPEERNPSNAEQFEPIKQQGIFIEQDAGLEHVQKRLEESNKRARSEFFETMMSRFDLLINALKKTQLNANKKELKNLQKEREMVVYRLTSYESLKLALDKHFENITEELKTEAEDRTLASSMMSFLGHSSNLLDEHFKNITEKVKTEVEGKTLASSVMSFLGRPSNVDSPSENITEELKTEGKEGNLASSMLSFLGHSSNSLDEHFKNITEKVKTEVGGGTLASSVMSFLGRPSNIDEPSETITEELKTEGRDGSLVSSVMSFLGRPINADESSENVTEELTTEKKEGELVSSVLAFLGRQPNLLEIAENEQTKKELKDQLLECVGNIFEKQEELRTLDELLVGKLSKSIAEWKESLVNLNHLTLFDEEGEKKTIHFLESDQEKMNHHVQEFSKIYKEIKFIVEQSSDIEQLLEGSLSIEQKMEAFFNCKKTFERNLEEKWKALFVAKESLEMEFKTEATIPEHVSSSTTTLSAFQSQQ